MFVKPDSKIRFDRNRDKVAIIAPASGCNNAQRSLDIEKSYANLQDIITLFAKYGFTCQYDHNMFEAHSNVPGYFASSREIRLLHLQNAIQDPEVKIISSFRGGYGCTDILFECLDLKISSPKILIGFSDITALHFLFNQHYGLPSIHGLVNMRYAHMMHKLIAILQGEDSSFDLSPINSIAIDNAVCDTHNVTGSVIGGNLTMICNMLGTSLHPDTNGKILFLEDVNEKSYQIHRHLVHMQNAKLFDNVRAVIFGEFTHSDHQLHIGLRYFVNEYLHSIPVYYTTNITHDKDNYPITIGSKAVIINSKLLVSNPFQLH